MEELCSLCGKRARMLCESDQAKLCWDCDHKVHGANFLVAKHSRILLCRTCQSPTPWKASGPTLTPTTSLCQRCCLHHHHHHHGDHSCSDDDAESDDDHDPEQEEEEQEEEEEEEEEEGENQVVPWSSASANNGNSEEVDGDISSATAGSGRLLLKRFSDNSFIQDSDDEIECSSSEALPNDESSSMSMFRPLKQPRISQREAAQWHNIRDGEDKI